MTPTLQRRSAMGLGALLAFAYGYFVYTGENFNINSRMGLTYALVEEGRLTIDSYHARPGTVTDDKAFFQGHYYTDKAIGASLLGAVVYAPLRRLLKALGLVLRPYHRAYLINLFVTALPSALAGCLMWGISTSLSSDRRRGLGAALAIALGTMLWPFSTVLFGHALAAALLFSAFAVILRMRLTPSARGAAGHLLLGTLLGWALITEYTAALAAAALIVYYLWVTWGPRPWQRVAGWLPLVLGVAAPVGLQLLNNSLSFGSPWANAYHYFSRPDIQQGMNQAVVGVGWPRLNVLYYLTVHPVRGIFAQSPVLIAAVAGYGWLLRDPRWRAEGWLSLFLLTAFLLMNAGFVWWTGGASFGPRYLIPMLPFLCLPLAAWPKRYFPVVPALAAVSVMQMLIVTAANPLIWNKTIRDFERSLGVAALPWQGFSPIYDHALSALRAGYFEPNLGTYLGLTHWASLLPLLVVLAGGIWWLAWEGPS